MGEDLTKPFCSHHHENMRRLDKQDMSIEAVSKKADINCAKIKSVENKVSDLNIRVVEDHSTTVHVRETLNTLVAELQSIRRLMYGVSLTVIVAIAGIVIRETLK